MAQSKRAAHYIPVSHTPAELTIEMLQSVLFAKLRFHDTTSRGRLLNRFGKDVEGLDSKMADNFSKSLEYGLSVIATFASIAWIGGWPFLGAGL